MVTIERDKVKNYVVKPYYKIIIKNELLAPHQNVSTNQKLMANRSRAQISWRASC
jgi:hypothetical protein